ncbi:SET and MYND domain-containing protein 4 [Diachasma alloeum]|uniref:SET and MYND domain-containing protein 4 n=1 Tax=Diachasma alloeum TaxID=454923 RepID=UPI0007381926|nr:SET and MYND domain-containing protein 4 [Diachasma alloeum]
MDLRIPNYIRSNPHVINVINGVNKRGFSFLENDEEKIKFTVPYFELFLNTATFPTDEKSTEKSIAFREEGNSEFVSNIYSNLDNIIAIYTKSVAYSPGDTKELALAYANRSAALFKARAYEDCLLDIEKALGSDLYPDRLRAKLLVRKCKCLYALKRSNEAEFRRTTLAVSQWLGKMDPKDSSRETIRAFLERPKADESNKDVGEPFKKWPCEDYSPELLDESASLPGISSGLKLKYSEDFGRHFVAAKDIKPGEILGVQKPYAKVICPEMFYRLCWHCAGQIRAGIPCRSCVYAVFCDEECRRNAWREYHDMECLILPLVQAQEVDHVFLMAFRLSILAMKEAGGIDGVKNVLRKIESCSDSLTKGFVKGILHPSEFSSICGLMQHADKRSPFAQFWWSFSSLFISILIVRSTEAMREYVIADIVCAVSREDFISVAALIFRNMQIAANNGYFVTSEKHGKTVNRYFAITPAFSLFNHSCHASAGLHDFKNKLAVYALTPIKAGDQVFINYGCDFLSHTRTERREKLKIEYCFNCKCIACENDWTSEDCQSYQKQELSLIGRATINEVLAGRDQMLRTIFNESLEGINFPFRISKLVDCIVHFNEHARAPCKELIELEKSLNRAFRFYGNRYESLE